ncbi:MAG: ATP-binding protein [Chloroflexi bacterium]|nr:ATP-binding protein [Chloroflexota bacterium]
MIATLLAPWRGRGRAGSFLWTGSIILISVGLVTALIGVVLSWHHIDTISILYLLAVLGVAIAFGSRAAVIAAVLSFLAFDWFFVPPIHEFTIDDPSEWISLTLFLVVAIVTGQLVAIVHRRAIEAETREREAQLLYNVVRVIDGTGLEQALTSIAQRLGEELHLMATVIDIQDGKSIALRVSAGDSAPALVEQELTMPHGVLTHTDALPAQRHEAPERWVRVAPSLPPGTGARRSDRAVYVVPIYAGPQRLGALFLARSHNAGQPSAQETRLLATLSTQLGLAIERIRLQQEANEAEILKRADEQKTALLHAVSHDLRTPLASIIASAGSLRQRDVEWSEEERRDFAEAIEEEALRLNRIVGNLLDLSRIEAGTLHPQREWYDLGALLDDVLGRLRAHLAEHPVRLKMPSDLPPVYLDYVEIDQVLSNLVENAVRYTPPGTAIEITVHVVGDVVQVEVADRGPGIPPEALPRLFDRFYRVETSGARPHGTGVGLAVARGIVEAHGGRIWAERRHDGGACFVFTLPLERADPSRPPASEEVPA